mmetsp:Transcript_10714/g.29806  ORF Transcript_10714/g.29806 Transcript_10714/m.29806 type:complete len:224 (+) Transcript_10714:1368-2039(+)
MPQVGQRGRPTLAEMERSGCGTVVLLRILSLSQLHKSASDSLPALAKCGSGRLDRLSLLQALCTQSLHLLLQPGVLPKPFVTSSIRIAWGHGNCCWLWSVRGNRRTGTRQPASACCDDTSFSRSSLLCATEQSFGSAHPSTATARAPRRSGRHNTGLFRAVPTGGRQGVAARDLLQQTVISVLPAWSCLGGSLTRHTRARPGVQASCAVVRRLGHIVAAHDRA